MKIVLIGANGKIGELVQKALAGAGHEIVKVGRKSGDFQVEIENRESVRKLYQAVGSFDAVAIAAGQVAFAPLSELTAEKWQFSLGIMLDETTHKDRLQRDPPKGLNGILQSKDEDTEESEAACRAFGYLRGIRDHSAAVEFRFRDGNSMWFPYSWLGTWRFNPSEGLLLKFSGDLVYIVLIRGSNLDRPLKKGSV